MNDTAIHPAGTALPLLSDDWRAWLNDNLARGCSVHDIANAMVTNGHFSLSLARAAIDEAAQRGHSLFQAPLALPSIDLQANRFEVEGREVEILLTVNQPRVVLLGNVLGDDECAAIVAHCEDSYSRASTLDDATGAHNVDTNRTNDMAYILRGQNPLVDRIERRLAQLANWPVECGEPFQLQRYGPTHEYKPHFDWFNEEFEGHRINLQRGGQRLATIILYLTDVEQGGGTSFPKLGLEVYPKKGNALFFVNTDAEHRPDPQTLHAGSPVIRGTKIIANKWLRQTVY